MGTPKRSPTFSLLLSGLAGLELVPPSLKEHLLRAVVVKHKFRKAFSLLWVCLRLWRVGIRVQEPGASPWRVQRYYHLRGAGMSGAIFHELRPRNNGRAAGKLVGVGWVRAGGRGGWRAGHGAAGLARGTGPRAEAS